MNISRTKLIKSIYDRLVELESDPSKDQVTKDQEMKQLRVRLQDLMNSKCPIFGGQLQSH